MRAPPISIRCECGSSAAIPYGDSWTCPTCGKTWDTSQIPREEFDAMLAEIARYRLLILGPPIALAVLLIPLAVLVDLRFAFLLFFLELGFALLVVPPIRRRKAHRVAARTPKWRLRPE